MIENLPFTRFVVILKGIEQKGKIPFGYVKVQAIVDMVNFEIVIQGLEETEDKITFWGVVKKLNEYYPVFLTALSKPQKGNIVQFLSTSRFNLFKSSWKLTDLVGFAIAKEKKGKPNFILIGSFDDSSLYEMERDILRGSEKGENKKNQDKKDMDNHDEKKEVEVEKEEKTESFSSKDDDKSLGENCSQDVEKEIVQEKEQEAEGEMPQGSAEKAQKEEESSEIVESALQELQKTYQDDKEEEASFRLDVEKNYCILEFGDKKIWRRIFEELKEKCERFDPFSDDKVKWFKIDKKDIITVSHLHPFLYVISNPFVFNLVSEHGYLIIGYRRSKRKRDRVEILVPAEFSEETEKRAKSFGFSEFVTKDGKVMDGKEGYFKMSLELIEKEE